MKLPRFILGDNTDYPESIFIIHTEFPRFIIDLKTDDIEWFEDFDVENEEEMIEETNNLIKEASEFYDREVDRYQK
ncbi:hypothetical protein G3567_06995 [Psychroflexus sp. YR1-1]|uniref:Uncharacterized protein n=1 Tax=Psychroflexus aurantiacus TaxID=2709310 RepID=A0A6B3R4M6_9FLAO|nr:hypothetical protein [Psychroflexus aurantiacus]NEV93895.1 hypothetical protein [Psychroflexus aurantiacus]